MRRFLMPLAFAALLLAAAMPRASAEWTEVQVTPKDLSNFDRIFTITAAPREGLIEYRVTVKPKAGSKTRPLSPFAVGSLDLIEGDHRVATVPIAADWDGDSVMLWFRVSPQSLARSTFEFREQGYGVSRDSRGEPVRDAQGKPKVEQTLGGSAYRFRLEDFTPPSRPR